MDDVMEHTQQIPCNNCGRPTEHRMLTDKTVCEWNDEPPQGVPENPDEADWREVYELFQCYGCLNVTLRLRT